ncbi:MAG: sigma factor-like helix-turn-helix DNA-binding protein, partial [bacterium]|nr:sigma factor-like helix-turn-helix DNA-binding protein [bacterium]
ALEHSGICEPTIEEIAEKMQLTIEQVTELKKAEERNSVVSLEALISNTTNEMEVIGAVSSLETITEDAVILNQLKLNIQALLEGGLLKEREVEVLKLRFGFIDDIEKTRAEIAKKFGVTEQRICQIECRALEKLRKYPPIAEYAIYMNNPTTSLYNLETYRQLYREGKKVKLPSKASKREEPKRKNSEKYSSIYSYLEPYTPEQIDQVIRQLTDYERYLLTLRFGDDFKTPPEVRTWTIEERQAYNALTGKIKRLLRKIVVEEIKSDSNQQLSENKSDKQELSMISTEKLCDQLKEMTQTPTFQTMLTYMTPQEAMITCLKLGYLTEEYIDSARISVLLGVDETEVQGLGKVALEKYKQYIINENRNNVVKQSIKLKRVQ